jgi:formate dehydrogenase subunit gamma
MTGERDPERETQPTRSDGGVSTEATEGGTREATDGGESPGWLARTWLELANEHERFEYLEKKDRTYLDFHTWGTILSHWLMVLLMLVATVTGLTKWLGNYGPLNIGIFDGYHVAFLGHIWAGVLLVVFAFLLYPFYSFVVDGKSPQFSTKQLKEQVIIALAFVGLASYIPGYKKARRTYDAENEEWVAHHPTQKAFWYATWFFVAVLTLTGFALWRHLSTDPTWWLSALGFMEGWVTFEMMLRLHLLSTAFFGAAILLHAYFPLVPSNHDLMKTMIHGKLLGWRVDEESKPAHRGAARSTDALGKPLAGIARLLGTDPDLEKRMSGPEEPEEPPEDMD